MAVRWSGARPAHEGKAPSARRVSDASQPGDPCTLALDPRHVQLRDNGRAPETTTARLDMTERDRLLAALIKEVLGPQGGPTEILLAAQDPRGEYVTGILAPADARPAP